MRLDFRALASPLALASYAALAAVWVGTLPPLAAAGVAPAALATSVLIGFTLGWLWMLAVPEGWSGRLDDAVLLLMAVLALVAVAMRPFGTAPILLVLVACMLALRFRRGALLTALLAVNLAFLGILLWRTQLGLLQSLVSTLAFAGFQGFGVLVLLSAQRAEAMAGQLRQVNASLLATRSLLDESARDAERLRLSRELHDVAGHKLTALKLNLNALARDPALAERRELEVSQTLAGELLEDLRAVVRQLRQHDGLDLAQALRQLADPLPRPRVLIEVADDARVPAAEQAEVLLRVAQEGLTNAARHSGAARAWLRLTRAHDGLELSLEDDGRVRLPLKPGHGLTGMRERIEALGGRLECLRSRHGGLKLTARLPLELPA